MINNKMKDEIIARDAAIIALKGIISTRDAKIASLKARVAELEKGDQFCSLLYSPWRDNEAECLTDFFNRYGAVEITPVRIKRQTSLPDVWGVLVPRSNEDDTTAHTFPTKAEAEAFCRQERAKQGEGA